MEITIDQLHAHALRNITDHCQIKDITWYLAHMFGMPIENIPHSSPQMLIINYDVNDYGAAVILSNDVLQSIAKQLGNTYTILPSSIHEIIAVRESGHLAEFSDMVREINDTQVSPTEKLCDYAFLYDNGKLIPYKPASKK